MKTRGMEERDDDVRPKEGGRGFVSLSLSLSLIFFGLSDLRYLVRRRLSIRQRIFFFSNRPFEIDDKMQRPPFFF